MKQKSSLKYFHANEKITAKERTDEQNKLVKDYFNYIKNIEKNVWKLRAIHKKIGYIDNLELSKCFEYLTADEMQKAIAILKVCYNQIGLLHESFGGDENQIHEQIDQIKNGEVIVWPDPFDSINIEIPEDEAIDALKSIAGIKKKKK